MMNYDKRDLYPICTPQGKRKLFSLEQPSLCERQRTASGNDKICPAPAAPPLSALTLRYFILKHLSRNSITTFGNSSHPLAFLFRLLDLFVSPFFLHCFSGFLLALFLRVLAFAHDFCSIVEKFEFFIADSTPWEGRLPPVGIEVPDWRRYQPDSPR